MPFRSAKQEAWMFANKPTLAEKWAQKYGNAKGYSSYLKRRKRKSYGKRKRG